MRKSWGETVGVEAFVIPVRAHHSQLAGAHGAPVVFLHAFPLQPFDCPLSMALQLLHPRCLPVVGPSSSPLMLMWTCAWTDQECGGYR